ncbi:hypothetical protein TL16_g04118 [Triparma laevis f. inornata]|uniref:Band 7 domain-containing protein n=1 Tax=Triparma laevis f. inornata TaxID=1714386 RepID=A0A9W7A3D3_9STRA|nr:hypothetical protein TL16_g04118 [Triparma laevis f. inornata]
MPREWDSEGAPERRKKYLSTFVMACTIVFPWLLGYSFDTIDPGYVGLLWNQNLHNLDSNKLWKEGRHFIGLGCHLIIFPTYAQFVNQGYIQARTKDGLAVQIQPSFQYQINDNLDDVAGLYKAFGGSYEETFISISRMNIRDVVSTFVAYDLVKHRDTLASNLEAGLNTKLSDFGVNVIGYQVLSIQWSNTIDNAIMAAVTELENVKTAHAEKNISQIEALTAVEEAKVLSENAIIIANQTAAILLATKEAEASNIVIQGTAQAQAFAAVKANITQADGTTPMTGDELLKYVYLENMVSQMNVFEERKVAVKVPADIQGVIDAL